jgi:hypothetical protein
VRAREQGGEAVTHLDLDGSIVDIWVRGRGDGGRGSARPSGEEEEWGRGSFSEVVGMREGPHRKEAQQKGCKGKRQRRPKGVGRRRGSRSDAEGGKKRPSPPRRLPDGAAAACDATTEPLLRLPFPLPYLTAVRQPQQLPVVLTALPGYPILCGTGGRSLRAVVVVLLHCCSATAAPVVVVVVLVRVNYCWAREAGLGAPNLHSPHLLNQ